MLSCIVAKETRLKDFLSPQLTAGASGMPGVSREVFKKYSWCIEGKTPIFLPKTDLNNSQTEVYVQIVAFIDEIST